MGDGIVVTSYFQGNQTSMTADKYTQAFVQMVNQICRDNQKSKEVR